MPGRRRLSIKDIDYRTTSRFVHDLLVQELGATLVPDSDKTVPQRWAAPKLTKKEEEKMGLFDEYAKAGIDLGDIDLSGFNYPDGLYQMAFIGGDYQPGKFGGYQIETRWLIVGDAQGNKVKQSGKSYTKWLAIPPVSDLKSDDDDKRKKSNGALQATFQFLYAMGIEDPKTMELAELAKLKTRKYVMQLNTPRENNPNMKQFGNIKSKVEANSSPETDVYEEAENDE